MAAVGGEETREVSGHSGVLSGVTLSVLPFIQRCHLPHLNPPSSAPTACSATAAAARCAAAGTLAGVSVVQQMLFLWMVCTTGKEAREPSRERATITASSHTKGTHFSAYSPFS